MTTCLFVQSSSSSSSDGDSAESCESEENKSASEVETITKSPVKTPRKKDVPVSVCFL